MGRSMEKKLARAVELNRTISPPQDQKALPVDVDSSKSSQIEQDHVFDVYEKIAEHFGHTRYKMWPRVENFLRSLSTETNPYPLVLDAGCGNGKNLCLPGMLGSDRAKAFCDLANKQTKKDCFISDISKDTGVSLRCKCLDAAISIAVIHHIPTLEGRIEALKQLARPLKSGGKLLIYVWAFEQEKGTVGARKFETQDVFVPWHYQTKYDDSEKQGLQKLHRYYHVFTKSEIIDLLQQVSNLFKVDDIYYDSNNWAAILTRNL